MTASRFERYFLGPVVTSALLLLVYASSRYESYTIALALPLAGLAVSTYYGGLRSNLASAGLIILYAIMSGDFDFSYIAQISVASLTIAGSSGILKLRFREKILEVEYYRQKAEDSYNGNRAKMLQALDKLDQAIEILERQASPPLKPALKLIQEARIKQADTLTLVGSWREMARDKELAIKHLEQTGDYLWRAEEQIKETHSLVREILAEVRRSNRILEGKS